MAKRVTSGANLPLRLENLVWRFRDHLKQSRDAGRVNPASPITAQRITEAYKAKGLDVNNVDICAMVNFLRRNNVPIASGSNGYFYARSESELEATKKMLRDKIKGERAALDGLEMAFNVDLSGRTLEVSKEPAVDVVEVDKRQGGSSDLLNTAKEMFGLEPVENT